MQPTPTDSLADFEVGHSVPYSLNEANTFMAQTAAFLFGMKVGCA
jgi:hypothetical protein